VSILTWSATSRRESSRGQVGFAEKVLGGALGLFPQIHLAGAQSLQQITRGQIHQLNFRLIQDAVRYRFAHFRAGNLADRVRATFQVLDIQGGVNIHARSQELIDVLPALGVAAAGGVRVRQFVNQRQLRTPQ